MDDDIDIRESLGEFLEDQDYTVATATDGADALVQMEGGDPPCVVILDLMMPVLSGNELYRRMQENPRLARVPVIVTTSDPSRAPRGLPIMKKPVDLNRLLSAVRKLCA